MENNKQIVELKAENEALKKELAIKNKALDLAVDEVCYYRDNLLFKTTNRLFVEQAKKELEGLK